MKKVLLMTAHESALVLIEGHDLGYTVSVLEDACSAFNQRQRQQVLEDVVHHFGQRLTSNKFLQQVKTKPEVALS